MRGLAKLLEAGKRHSAGDQQMLQTMHDHAVSLGASCGAMESARDEPPVFHFDEAEMSYSDITDLIRAALKTQYAGAGIWVYPRDVYPDYVVYSVSNNDDSTSKLYQRNYSLTNATVTFTSDPVEVQAVTNYVAVSESDPGDLAESEEITGELVPLVEKAVKQDGTAKIKIIQAGQGSSGYYPADVLKRDAAVFAEGTHIYLDHPTADEEKTRPERSIKDLAGSLTGPAVWEESGTAGPGLYAPVKFIDAVAPHINDIAPISGMSIRANGKVGTREIDGKKVRTIESITAASSIDVVTRAGAGGRIVDLIESARGRHTEQPERTDDVDKAEFEATKTALAEAQKQITAQAGELARIREAGILRDARALVVETLAKTSLPALTKSRLTESLVNGATAKDGALDKDALTTAIEAAVTSATAEIVEANGGNPVRGMGSTASVTESDAHTGLVESFVARGYSKDIAERMAAL